MPKAGRLYAINVAFPRVDHGAPFRCSLVLSASELWFLAREYKSRIVAPAGTPVYDALGAMDDNERRFYSQVVADLIKHPPPLLTIDKGMFKQGLSSDFDFAAYFNQDDSFSRLLRRYPRVATIAAFDLYVPHESSALADSFP